MIFDSQDGGPTRIEAYAYALAQADCDAAHETAGQWWGLLRGDLGASATARPELGLSDEERDFLRGQAGAIVHEHAPGRFHAVFYPTLERLGIAWRAVTSWQPPAASCAPAPGCAPALSPLVQEAFVARYCTGSHADLFEAKTAIERCHSWHDEHDVLSVRRSKPVAA